MEQGGHSWRTGTVDPEGEHFALAQGRSGTRGIRPWHGSGAETAGPWLWSFSREPNRLVSDMS
jgi:hypothetical protein